MSEASSKRQPSAVGKLLRHWRAARRLSQTHLALRANVSARHVSFVESGRASPSRHMVLQLAEALDIPLRERNLLLEAAGFVRYYPETRLEQAEMTQLRRAVEFMLRQHEPFGAVCVDRHWDVLARNVPHERLTAAVLEGVPSPEPLANNLLRFLFHPDGLRGCVVNWDEVARAMLGRLSREIAANPTDDQLERLRDELLSYPSARGRLSVPDFTVPPPIVLPLHLRKGDLELRLFGTITTIGTPQDVTAQELRIEAFFPADESTDRLLRDAGEAGLAAAPADGRRHGGQRP